jgi:hypothetical protein
MSQTQVQTRQAFIYGFHKQQGYTMNAKTELTLPLARSKKNKRMKFTFNCGLYVYSDSTEPLQPQQS